jgi:hypothetical protein
MVIKKGFTILQLERCLAEYQTLGVMVVDRDKTQITIEDEEVEGHSQGQGF